MAVETPSGTKVISDVLFVPEIDQNLLRLGQLLEKNNSLVFKDKTCIINDPTSHELFTILMRGKFFYWSLKKLNQLHLLVHMMNPLCGIEDWSILIILL